MKKSVFLIFAVLIILLVIKSCTRSAEPQFCENWEAFEAVAERILKEENGILILKEEYDRADCDLHAIFSQTDVATIIKHFPCKDMVSFLIEDSLINWYGIVYCPGMETKNPSAAGYTVKRIEGAWFTWLE